VTPFLVRWAESTWSILLDSALLFLIGLVLAGLLWLVLNERTVANLLRAGRGSGVIKAAVIGVPLPLCSCSVLPVATQLRRSGVDRGAVTAFLIATPESGVDSILLTLSLTDPLLTIARPVSAFLTATAAGLVEVGFGSESSAEAKILPQDCCDTCRKPGGATASDAAPWPQRIGAGIRYAFLDLMADLAPYLAFGFLLAGLVGALLQGPGNWSALAGVHGWMGYLWALVIGVPLYICAASSTPLAATMLAAGFSPGAILVFLLVGPATNVTTITVVRRILGVGSTLRYLATIVVMALLCGIALDAVYRFCEVVPHYSSTSLPTEGSSLVSVLAAAALAGAILYFSVRHLLRRWK